MHSTIGLALAVLGGAVGLGADHAIEGAWRRASPAERDAASRGWPAWATAVVAVALALHFAMQAAGRARLGLRVAVPILIVNAIAIGAVRSRGAANTEVRVQVRSYAWLQAAGFVTCFAGVYVYLVRP
jgi:hypothetical protein